MGGVVMTSSEKIQAILSFSGPMLTEHKMESIRLSKKQQFDLIDELAIDSIFQIYKPPLVKATGPAVLSNHDKLKMILNFSGTISKTHKDEAARLLKKLETSRLSSIDEMSIDGIIGMWDILKSPSP